MLVSHIITEDTAEDYPIRPTHIYSFPTNFLEVFGDLETAKTAAVIIDFCHKINRNSWWPFSLEDLKKFLRHRQLKEDYSDIQKLGREMTIVREGVCYITHKFVTSCYLASPNIAK